MLVCPGTVLREFYQTWQAAPIVDSGLFGVPSVHIMNLVWDDSAGTEVGFRREVNLQLVLYIVTRHADPPGDILVQL